MIVCLFNGVELKSLLQVAPQEAVVDGAAVDAQSVAEVGVVEEEGGAEMTTSYNRIPFLNKDQQRGSFVEVRASFNIF